MIQMGTFAQWVKTQEDRQDAVGYFARYWASVTPGKISSVDGVFKRLSAIEKEYAGGHDEKGKAAAGAAVSGYHLAVKEYHRARAADQAASHGLVVRVPDEEPPPVTEPAPREPDMSSRGAGLPSEPNMLPTQPGVAPHERYQLDHDEHGPRIARRDDAPAGLPESRLAALEARFDRMERLVIEAVGSLDHDLSQRLDAVLDALYPEPVDWDALYGRARRAYEDEAFPQGGTE